MRKMFSVLIVLSLVLSLGSLSAFATSGSLSGESLGSNDISVQGIYNDSTTPSSAAYSVDISWGAMEFTYKAEGANVWNPDTHGYTQGTTASWVATGNTVTVTNHSNVGVVATFSYTSISDYSAITGTFDNATITLPSAVGKAVNDVNLVGTSTLTLSGVLPTSVTTMTTLGKITVALTAAPIS